MYNKTVLCYGIAIVSMALLYALVTYVSNFSSISHQTYQIISVVLIVGIVVGMVLGPFSIGDPLENKNDWRK